jgi:uncharacterized coiled-coil protein SlyX
MMTLMTDGKTLSDRIDALETRLTYQDEAIETLNQAITKQWLEIDRLTRRLAEMKERLQEAESQAPAPTNEPPPHY